MARFLRSYGVYYLRKPAVVLVPSVQQQQQTIRTQFAVQARVDRQRKCAPSIEARHPWLTLNRTHEVRSFNGDTDGIVAGPVAAPAGFGSFVWIIQRDAVNHDDSLGYLYQASNPTTALGGSEIFPGNSVRINNGAANVNSALSILPADGWQIVAVTKATGAVAPHFHKCVLSTGVWTHETAGSTLGNWTTAADSAAIARWPAGGFALGGDMLLMAYFDGVALADLTLESFTSISAIARAGPTHLWVLNQTSVAIPVNDESGGADQTSISGTQVASADIPNFNTDTPLSGQSTPFIGIRPPMIVGSGPTQQQQTLGVRLAGLDHDRTRRAPHSKLRPPTVVTTVTFIAEPISVALAKTRPRRTTRVLRPPTVLQVFSGPASRLVRARPRPTIWDLRPPQVVRVPSVEQRQQTISVRLVRGRAGKTDYRLNPPTVVRVPSVEQQQQTIRVRLVRGRRPETRSLLFPPTVVTTPVVQVFYTGRPVLVRTRPQPTTYTLEQPTTLQVFSGPRSELTKARPRATVYRLGEPQVVRVPSVEQQEQTIRVRVVQTRPRHTVYFLRPPQVVRVPSVEQAQRTLRVRLVRGRPGKTRADLFPPAVVTPFSSFVASAVRVQIVRARPRHTIWTLRPPQVVRVPSVEQQIRTFRIRLVRTRPRPTTHVLRPPVVVRVPSVEQQQRTVRDWLVRTRPRHTLTVLRPPTVVRTVGPPARKALVQTRPRPTSHVLRPPTVLRVFEAGAAVLVRIRPRHTIWQLRPPTVVAPFVAAIETTLHRWLVRIRPPQTRSHKPPPPFTPTVPGKGCLTDQLANQGCLTDGLAAVGCLTNQAGTAGCLIDQAGTEACLVDLSAATATLRDEN